MGIKRGFSAITLSYRINVQHKPRHFAPVCTLCIRIEQAQIRYNVLLVVCREDGIRRCSIGDVWISGWFLNAFVTERAILTPCQPK